MLIRLAPGVRIQLEGLHHVPASGAAIFMANHQSYVDVPALFFLPFQFRWMADEGLFRIPVFGWGMRLIGYIPVCRGRASSGLSALRKAQACLAEGISIFLFPEGSRSRTGVLGRFRSGGFRLAQETAAPIVPVVPPTEGRRLRALMKQVRTLMREEYRRLLQECPAG
jgi:1-acyl-sn-glycerol-3-phosphate acyltransferase